MPLGQQRQKSKATEGIEMESLTRRYHLPGPQRRKEWGKLIKAINRSVITAIPPRSLQPLLAPEEWTDEDEAASIDADLTKLMNAIRGNLRRREARSRIRPQDEPQRPNTRKSDRLRLKLNANRRVPREERLKRKRGLMKKMEQAKKQEDDWVDITANERAEQEFRKNRYGYATRLFEGEKEPVVPTFSRWEAELYLRRTLTPIGVCRVEELIKNQLPEPPEPTVAFRNRPPSLVAYESFVQSRKGQSAAGPDGIPFSIYQQSEQARLALYRVIIRLWRLGNHVPDVWTLCRLTPLHKKGDPSIPDNFRPIVLQNTASKIFFGLIGKSVARYANANGYLSQNQKGFRAGVAGCIEHQYVITECQRDARAMKKNLVLVFLDLKNAFGSVPHSLIDLALRRYRLPEWVCSVFGAYYRKVCVYMQKAAFETVAVPQRVGTVQGGSDSPILFNLAFNILLELHDRYAEGYRLTGSMLRFSSAVFADDFCGIYHSKESAQRAMTIVGQFIQATGDMSINSGKSKVMEIRHGVPGPAKTAALTLDGAVLPAMTAMEDFNFLGRLIRGKGNRSADLAETAVLRMTLQENAEVIDRQLIRGWMKVWLLQFCLTARLSWTLTVYDISPAGRIMDEGIDPLVLKYQKQWLGMCATSSESLLYRSCDHLGWQLAKPSSLVKLCSQRRAHALLSSRDERVRELAQVGAGKGTGRRWNPLREHIKMLGQLADRGVEVDRRGLTQSEKVKSEIRRYRTRLVDEAYRSQALKQPTQGIWTKWEEAVCVLRARNELESWSNSMVNFAANLWSNTLPDPVNLVRWKKPVSPLCTLCSHLGETNEASTSHILSMCAYASKFGRYRCRHDDVLGAILEVVVSAVREANRPVNPNTSVAAEKASRSADSRVSGRLKMASDWIVMSDTGTYAEYTWAQFGIQSDQRPDIVLSSSSSRLIVLLEVAVSREENLAASAAAKVAKYDGLLTALAGKGWRVVLLPLIAGARGHVHRGLSPALRTLGLSIAVTKTLARSIGRISINWALTLFIHRSNPSWSPECRYRSTEPAMIPAEQLLAKLNDEEINRVVTEWAKPSDEPCPKCGRGKLTAAHVLSYCSEKSQFIQRHDSILSYWASQILVSVAEVRTDGSGEDTILMAADDWRLLVDTEGSYQFPVEISATTDRPDMVLFSHKRGLVNLIELTVGNTASARRTHAFKEARYQALVTDCERNGWTTQLHCLEIGATGHVPKAVTVFFKRLGLREVKVVEETTAKLALMGSITLWKNRRKRTLEQAGVE